ncbi:MAG: coiled-coil domain-containing protein, partial [Planctomycetota bacterium]
MTLARRRLRPRQPVLGMVLVLTAALTALGQEAPTREAPPSTSTTTPQDLSAAALWSQVSERLAALRTLGERVAVLSLQHEAASQERARLTGERATLDTAIELPDPAVVPTQDSARALQERTEVRARSVDSARRIDAELAVALGREQSLVEELSGTERRQLATLRELDLLAKELERRTPALLGESWTGFSLPRESRPEVVGARIAEVESTLAKRAGMIEQGAALLRSLRERRAALERSSANLLHTRRVLANRLAEAVNRSEYGRVYGAQDAAALLSAQSARAGVWRQDLDKLEAATAERESAAAAAQGIRTEREALPTPSSEGLVVDEPTESLRSAKRALLEAEARRDYRRLRVELTGRLIGEVERLLLLTEEQTATVSAALHLTGELEVVGGILTERATKGEIDASALPEEPSKEALSHRGVGLRTQLANLESERLRLPVELEGLRASLKGDREVVEALDSEIPKLELAVQREESLARWIREVQELPTPKVLEQYRATADRLAAATVAIGRLNGITERADKEARGAEERANQLVDPLLRQAGPALESFRELAGEELTRWTSDPRYAELGVKPTPLLTVAGQLMPQGGSEAAVPVRPAASPSGSNGSESAVDLTEAQIEAVQARRAAVLGQV